MLLACSQSDIAFEVLLWYFLHVWKRTACSAHLITIDLISIDDVKYKFYVSSLNNLAYPPLIHCFILPSALFCNILHLWFSLGRDMIRYTHIYIQLE
jgi:hypothetical protein